MNLIKQRVSKEKCAEELTSTFMDKLYSMTLPILDIDQNNFEGVCTIIQYLLDLDHAEYKAFTLDQKYMNYLIHDRIYEDSYHCETCCSSEDCLKKLKLYYHLYVMNCSNYNCLYEGCIRTKKLLIHRKYCPLKHLCCICKEYELKKEVEVAARHL